jgi:Mce-associated membrane protein
LTAVLDPAPPITEGSPAEQVASWPARAGAFAIDVLVPLGVLATIALVAVSAVQGGWLWWVALTAAGVVVLAGAVNRLLLPSVTGWSVGRALAGIRVQPSGPWRLSARDAAHLLDTLALFVGWLWPLWDSRNRTFADLLLRTEVRRVADRPGNARRVAAGVLIGAAVLSVAVAGLGYLGVYRQDRAVDAARQQVSAQGPKIVAELLSYNASSLQADFTHAQSLTTDSYRPKLVAQQDAVRKAVPTTNEYWAANSAVLSVSPDRAVMLIMLQGQRTASQQQQRFITATLRVNFERSAHGQWRVADLAVLSKPPTNRPDK